MKDKNIKLSGTPCFSPPGSAAPRKRLSKPVLILFALAIIFAILGFIDLKVNAAESETYVSSWWSKIYVDSNGEEQVAKNDWYTYTSSSPLEVFYYQSHDDYVTGEPVAFAIYVVSDSPITASGSTSSFKSTEYVFDDRTINVCMSSSGTSFASPLSGYVEVTTDADNVKRLNSMYSMDEFVDYYESEVNAAESTQSIEFLTTWYNTLEGELVESLKYKYIFSCDSDMEVFYIQSHISATNTENTFAQVYVVSESPILRDKYTYSNGQYYYNDTYAGIQYTLNGQTFYVRQVADSCTNTGNGTWNGYVGLEFNYNGAKELSRWYDVDEFVQAYANEYLDIVIDYDSFEVDDSLSTINNLLYNIIRNEKPSENDTTGLGIIKDVEYYEYLTWNNTLDLPIQVEYVPIVQVYSGLFSEKFKKEYYGEWSDLLILDAGTNSYTKRTDSEYLFENDRLGIEFEKDIIDKYVEYLDNTYLFYGYRMRYVDVDNGRSGPWVYAVPRVNGTYYSYVEYSDDTVTEEEDITGTDNTYKNLDDISDAQSDIDKENAVKDEYGVTDTEISVSEVSTWLSTLVDFIKGSPPLVGSVLSFLPQPILYGMYMLIFLGVVGAGFAIVRALI